MTKTSSAPALTSSPRRRAPSRRSLATSQSILDAAERLFAEHGYDGASVRDIAAAAGAQIASVSFHHGSKEALFARVVERRAQELSRLRLDALDTVKARAEPLTLEGVLQAFLRPYLDKAGLDGTGAGDPQWLAYARLVAMVSADARWHRISERCFDPTAGLFIAEIAKLFPKADPSRLAVAFVFSVSAMLSLSTSRWRIETLSSASPAESGTEDLADDLIRFCEAGFRAAIDG
ncbi:MAG: TetR family transcriptional regulator [Hoeflea sp.]|uniref:TetR/AcrR family transcriptional regulator n=1 Tax=Hoeflea sp. TaxID=1940281 RepID=UPI001DBD5DEB|nr:TetR/AcrR family transcriptional regulator [Hoeflea sp.]MBU4528832.1 TetR family transcriptional regulator [Alphaproteobacteria bacterium]MBU4545841.1 TetR family transcriptional regulator [Alphaproteobacteria bacterium]MBU4549966.1 TetR family transcriptional regulator [Alphaproteobacteria bacterium]MBV1725963.1 TetR family transcriptional regulator [Hoeflea sp.]MBV1762688.1 TetR family transcriptional regulator [Hoeflea sp.]